MMWFQRFICLFVCLFVCLFIVSLEHFSLIWRPHHYRWGAANFDLCSALMAIEQWRFLSVPQLLWHGASFYKGHLRGPLTITPISRAFSSEAVTKGRWMRHSRKTLMTLEFSFPDWINVNQTWHHSFFCEGNSKFTVYSE